MRKKIFFVFLAFLFLFTGARLAVADNKNKNSNEQLYRQVEVFSDALAIVQKSMSMNPKLKI